MMMRILNLDYGIGGIPKMKWFKLETLWPALLLVALLPYMMGTTWSTVGTFSSLGVGVSAPSGAGDLTVNDQLIVSGTGPHAIGAATSNDKRLTLGGAYTSLGASTVFIGTDISGTLTAANGDTARHSGVTIRNGFTTQNNSETVAAISQLRVENVTITTGDDTVTAAATVHIIDAMAGATSNYALWVDGGSVRLDGSMWTEGTPTEGADGEQLTSGGAGAVLDWSADSSLREYKQDIVQRRNAAISLNLMSQAKVYDFKYLLQNMLMM